MPKAKLFWLVIAESDYDSPAQIYMVADVDRATAYWRIHDQLVKDYGKRYANKKSYSIQYLKESDCVVESTMME